MSDKAIVWIRDDFRINNNDALTYATNNHDLVTAVFIFNNNIFGSLFYDYGFIQQYKDPSNITLTTPNKYSLSGWGVAFDFNPNQDFSFKLVLSKTIGSNDGKSNTGMNSDGRDDTSRAWLLLSYDF